MSAVPDVGGNIPVRIDLQRKQDMNNTHKIMILELDLIYIK